MSDIPNPRWVKAGPNTAYVATKAINPSSCSFGNIFECFTGNGLFALCFGEIAQKYDTTDFLTRTPIPFFFLLQAFCHEQEAVCIPTVLRQIDTRPRRIPRPDFRDALCPD